MKMKKIFILILMTLVFYGSGVYAQSRNIFFLIPFYMPETNVGLTFTDILHFKKDDQKHFSALNFFALYTLKNQFILTVTIICWKESWYIQVLKENISV